MTRLSATLLLLVVSSAHAETAVAPVEPLQLIIWSGGDVGLAEACPSFDNDWADGGRVRKALPGGLELSAVVLTSHQNDGASSLWLESRCPIFVALRDASGRLVASRTVSHLRCQLDKVRVTKAGIVVELNYTSRGCTQDERSDKTLLLAEDHRAIVEKVLSMEVTQKMSCD